MKTLATDVYNGHWSAALTDCGRGFTDFFSSTASSVETIVKQDISADNIVVDDVTRIDVAADWEDFSQDVNTLVDQNTAIIETVGIGARSR
jgi:hypothetical protein